MGPSMTAKHYFLAANLLILGLLIWLAVSFGMSILKGRLSAGGPSGRPVESAGNTAPRLGPADRYRAISRFDIFGGTRGGKAAEPGGEASSAPPPSEDAELALRGIIEGENPRDSAAVIEDVKSGEQDIYRPGQKIGAAQLAAIHPDWVLIRRGGREVRLNIHLDEGPAVRPERNRSLPFSHDTREAPDQDEAIGRQVGPGHWIVNRRVMAEHMGDLNYFLSNVMIKPHFQDGQPAGFLVASVKPGSPIHSLGLRRGDVVSKINGISVTKPEDLVNMYHQVQQMETVEVEVTRNGSASTFTYTFK